MQTTVFCLEAHNWGLCIYSTKMICISVGRSRSEVFCQSLKNMPWWGELAQPADHKQRVILLQPTRVWTPLHFLFLSNKYKNVQNATYFCLNCEHTHTRTCTHTWTKTYNKFKTETSTRAHAHTPSHRYKGVTTVTEECTSHRPPSVSSLAVCTCICVCVRVQLWWRLLNATFTSILLCNKHLFFLIFNIIWCQTRSSGNISWCDQSTDDINTNWESTDGFSENTFKGSASTNMREDQLGEVFHHWTRMSLTWLMLLWESHRSLWPHLDVHFSKPNNRSFLSCWL